MVAPVKEEKKTEFSMNSLEDVKTVIKNGHLEDWERVLYFPVNKDRSGLG